MRQLSPADALLAVLVMAASALAFETLGHGDTRLGAVSTIAVLQPNALQLEIDVDRADSPSIRTAASPAKPTAPFATAIASR
jgi:hypothetical protein